jgi:hypothetical protein
MGSIAQTADIDDGLCIGSSEPAAEVRILTPPLEVPHAAVQSDLIARLSSSERTCANVVTDGLGRGDRLALTAGLQPTRVRAEALQRVRSIGFPHVSHSPACGTTGIGANAPVDECAQLGARK